MFGFGKKETVRDTSDGYKAVKDFFEITFSRYEEGEGYFTTEIKEDDCPKLEVGVVIEDELIFMELVLLDKVPVSETYIMNNLLSLINQDVLTPLILRLDGDGDIGCGIVISKINITDKIVEEMYSYLLSVMKKYARYIVGFIRHEISMTDFLSCVSDSSGLSLLLDSREEVGN